MSSKVDLAAVGVSFGIQCAIAAGILIAFTLILRPTNKTVYEPRTKFAPESKKPQPLPSTPTISWVPVVIKSDLLEQVNKIGLDAYMFLRFLRFGMEYFALLTVFGIPLCLIHAFVPNAFKKQAQTVASQQQQYSLEILTINNLDSERNTPAEIFYLHASLNWIFAFWAFYNLYRIWKEYLQLRKLWFDSNDFLNGFQNNVLMLSDIPDAYKSPSSLQAFLRSKGITYQCHQIVFGKDCKELTRLVEKHKKYTVMMEKAIALYLRTGKRRRPTHTEGAKLGLFGGEKVDTLEFCAKELQKLERQIYALRAKGDSYFKSDSSAFISYQTVGESHHVAKQFDDQVFLGSTPILLHEPRIKTCPPVESILWQNIGLSRGMRHIRTLIGLVLIVAITVLWTALVAFITSLWQLNNLRAIFPNLDPSQPSIVFVMSLVSPLLLAVLNIILPHVLRLLSRIQGGKTANGIEKGVLIKYFAFLVYQFFVNVGSSVSVKNVQPGFSADFLRVAAVGFTAVSSFYVSLVATGYAGYSIELAQAAPLLFNFFNRYFFRNTPRREFELNQPPEFQYSFIYGLLLYYFMIGASYSLSAPFITPFILLLFVFAYFVMKYQMLYVYETKYETGGSWWPTVFNLVCSSLILMQIFNTACLVLTTWNRSIAKPSGPVVMSAILPFLTLVFCLYMNLAWGKSAKYVDRSSRAYYAGQQSKSTHSPQRETFLQLRDCVFNPALAKPLYKVWVKKEYREELEQLYHPEFTNLEDYVLRQQLQGASTDTMVAVDEPGSEQKGDFLKRLKQRAKFATRQETKLKRQYTSKRFSLHDDESRSPVELGGEFEEIDESIVGEQDLQRVRSQDTLSPVQQGPHNLQRVRSQDSLSPVQQGPHNLQRIRSQDSLSPAHLVPHNLQRIPSQDSLALQQAPPMGMMAPMVYPPAVNHVYAPVLTVYPSHPPSTHPPSNHPPSTHPPTRTSSQANASHHPVYYY